MQYRPIQILSFPAMATPAALRQQALDLQDEAWPPDATPREARTGHDPALAPLSILLVDGETVLAVLDILFKQIEHCGDFYRAAGLSSVVSRKASRGEGHGRRLVRAAHDAIAIMALDVGLFTCDRPLKGFYEQAGWHELEDAVVIGGTPANPFPSDQPGFDKVTMADFFSSRAQSKASQFRDSRIALYPGEIDKLWWLSRRSHTACDAVHAQQQRSLQRWVFLASAAPALDLQVVESQVAATNVQARARHGQLELRSAKRSSTRRSDRSFISLGYFVGSGRDSTSVGSMPPPDPEPVHVMREQHLARCTVTVRPC